jgi:hypothetical protein
MARATTDGCMSIDVRNWHREGLLLDGIGFAHFLTWLGSPTEGIAVLVESDAVVLVFRSRSFGGGYGEQIAQRVPLTWTPCSFGGKRPWFRCEAYRNSRYCGRRAALLYSCGGVFACRHCHDLSYQSQNETPRLRSIRRVRKIRMRLGTGFSFAEPLPDKPPGMHWKTYRRLRTAVGGW